MGVVPCCQCWHGGPRAVQKLSHPAGLPGPPRAVDGTGLPAQPEGMGRNQVGFTAGTAEPWSKGGFPPSQPKAKKLPAHPGQVYEGHSASSACWRCPPHLFVAKCPAEGNSIGKCDVGLSTHLGSWPSSPVPEQWMEGLLGLSSSPSSYMHSLEPQTLANKACPNHKYLSRTITTPNHT